MGGTILEPDRLWELIETLRQFSAQPATSVAEKIVWYDQVKPVIDRLVADGQTQNWENDELRSVIKARDREAENLKARIDMLQSDLATLKDRHDQQRPAVNQMSDAITSAIGTLNGWQGETVEPADKAPPFEAEEFARLRGELSRRSTEVAHLTDRLGRAQSELEIIKSRYEQQQPNLERLKLVVWNAIKTLEAVRK